MSQEPARPPRDKRPSGWYQDFQVSKVAKKSASPTLKPKQPGLPPRPPPRADAAERQGEDPLEEQEEVLLIATQEEDAHKKLAPEDQEALDQKALEEELNRTPGLAGLVELATTPVGTPMTLGGQSGQAPPALDLAGELPDSERRVTIWNPYEKRKLSGNSAPFKKNLDEYLRKHPDWEEYWGQDLDEHGRKLFPRKRRRASAEPSPNLKPQPEQGLSMMDGLLKLATEQQEKPRSSPVLGSLQSRQSHQAPQAHESMLLGSVLDCVNTKVAAEFSQPQPEPAAGEQTALSLVGGVVVEAIEDSCRDTLWPPESSKPPAPSSSTAGLGLNGAPPPPSVSSC